jgi:hypothetical protein
MITARAGADTASVKPTAHAAAALVKQDNAFMKFSFLLARLSKKYCYTVA